MQLSISCKHNASQVAREFSNLDERDQRVPADAMPIAVAAIEQDVEVEIERIAGGVYWDINSRVEISPGGAIGQVWTDRSKPHSIDAHEPRRPLRFRTREGQWISTYHVNHPGSRPVNWAPAVSRSQRVKQIFSDQMRRAVSGGGSSFVSPRGGR